MTSDDMAIVILFVAILTLIGWVIHCLTRK
jgi:hypothetical protein